MKKIFSLVIALVAALSMNATDYYLSGINGNWNEPGTNAAMLLVPGEGSVRTVALERLESCEFKVFANTGWGGPEYGAAAAGDAVEANGAAYTMASPAQNLKVGGLAEGHYLANATISVDTAAWTVTVVGTDVDGSAEPDTYQLVGACTNNWSPADAIQFEDVNGVLTATVPALSGGFKIIKNRKWGWEAAAAAGESLALNTPMTLVTSNGANITLANPFGGYNNAVITLDITNIDAPVITLTGGEFAMSEAHWYVPGTKLGWNCNETTELTAVDGKENTYEFLAAEFGKDFKVVFGNWGVEFGAPKGSEDFKWEVNKELELSTPCDNLHPLVDEIITDATITIVVDYEKVVVKLLIATEEQQEQALINSTVNGKAAKAIIGNELVVIKNGVRYNVLGARL